VLGFAAIIGGTLFRVLLLLHPVRQCTSCGQRWPDEGP